MRGFILDVDLKNDSGIIRGEDKNKYEFALQSCVKGAPLPGSAVDFDLSEGKAVSVYVLEMPLKAKLDWLFWFLFSFRGRISRDQLIIFLTASLLFLPVPAVCAVWSGLSLFWEIGGLLYAFVFAAVLVKRFHDSGTSAAWLVFTAFFSLFVSALAVRALNLAFIGATALNVLLVLSGLTFVFCLYVCFAKGSVGENRYGAEPYSCKTVRMK